MQETKMITCINFEGRFGFSIKKIPVFIDILRDENFTHRKLPCPSIDSIQSMYLFNLYAATFIRTAARILMKISCL